MGGFAHATSETVLTNCVLHLEVGEMFFQPFKCVLCFSPFQSQVNHQGAASNETYQERLARLEGDKESLILQVGLFSWETAYPVNSNSVRTLSGREAQEVFSVGFILFQKCMFLKRLFLKQSRK